jgi:serine/threonine-protein kinase RsbW
MRAKRLLDANLKRRNGMATPTKETIEIRLPSELRYLGVVDAVVQSFASEFALDTDDVNSISTATIEAASNAMEHANQFDVAKSVLVRMHGQGSVFEVEVQDEGAGFDHQPYERELGPEDLLKLRGRGIFIMRSFMDEVRFMKVGDGGMRVYLRKVGKAEADDSDSQDAVREN